MTPDQITEDWVINRLDRIWPKHTDAFATLLIDLRRHFEGDLDSLLILATVAAGTQSRSWQATLLEETASEITASAATNTQSIASISGAPRESVRRKLSRFEQKGWVVRDEAGNWQPTAQAAADLRPATLATIAYLRTVLAAALDDAETPDANAR